MSKQALIALLVIAIGGVVAVLAFFAPLSLVY